MGKRNTVLCMLHVAHFMCLQIDSCVLHEYFPGRVASFIGEQTCVRKCACRGP